jgi:energy-converting hydrogenase Eha subunit H
MRHIRNMNTARHRSLAIAAALVTLPGCRAVGDIFKAGMWVAVIGIALLALIGYGVASIFRR